MHRRFSLRFGLNARKVFWAYVFLLVPCLFFFFFRILPTLSALRISLHDWDILSPSKPFVGLANYRRLLNDPIFWKALKNTFLYMFVVVPAELVGGLSIAIMLQSVRRFAGFLRSLYFLPFVTSAVAISWVWRWMYVPHYGTLNMILSFLGFTEQPFLQSPSQALYSIAAVVIWQSLGFHIIMFLAGLQAIPTVFYEAAMIDGANRWQVFRSITLPLLNPTIVFLAVMGSIASLKIFTQVMNMTFEGTGGPLHSTITLVLYIYQMAFTRFQMGYASAVTVILFMIIIVITVIQMRLITRRFEY
ncbi:MAG: sugar ABC transporter permease [Firmicutes bacterium]|nr:sugar ABC transporter permease [Bacillota bacterium]MCL5038629.1 sugar ABC transporter permease [Bacillota bacterium]